MEEEIKIPELAVFECKACGNQKVEVREAQMLCQNCVNEFLARNVGLMTIKQQKPSPGERPGDRILTDPAPNMPRIEDPVMPPDFLPGVEGDGTG